MATSKIWEKRFIFTFKRTNLRLFRFKISQCVPFLIKKPQNQSKTSKKGTNWEIWNLNNQRLGRFKGICMFKKKEFLLMGETLEKKLIFWVTSHFIRIKSIPDKNVVPPLQKKVNIPFLYF